MSFKNSKIFIFNGEQEIFKILLTYFGQRTFFAIIKPVFRGKHELYLFLYNAILKDRVLFK